jgi:hypothetical protein
MLPHAFEQGGDDVLFFWVHGDPSFIFLNFYAWAGMSYEA